MGLERVFQRSTQALDSPLAVKMSELPPSALENHTALKLHNRQKNRRRTDIYAEKHHVQLPMDSREGSLVSLGPVDSHLLRAC